MRTGTLRFNRAPRVLAVPLVVLAATLALTALPAQAGPPATTPTTEPGPAAAGWLARQMTDGQRFESTSQYGTFYDQGLTIDAILGFAEVGVSGFFAKNAIAWLSDPAVGDNYYGDFDADVTKGFASGPMAKLALAAQVMGKDPTAFGGLDLIATLVSLQGPNGKFNDTASYGDFTNAFGQSLGTIALARTGNHAQAAASAAAFLISTKCADGGYPLAFPKDPANCDSQVDATAMVVQALLAVGKTTDASAALDWLISKQGTDGGFGDEADTNPAPHNANSTGLAAQALRAGGRGAAADKAVVFLKSLQVGCSGAVANQGAIARDAVGFDGRAARATAQALLGLGGVGLADLKLDKDAKPEAPTLDCPVVAAPPVLPVTGDSVRPIAFAGAGLLVIGAGLLMLVRRRRA